MSLWTSDLLLPHPFGTDTTLPAEKLTERWGLAALDRSLLPYPMPCWLNYRTQGSYREAGQGWGEVGEVGRKAESLSLVCKQTKQSWGSPLETAKFQTGSRASECPGREGGWCWEACWWLRGGCGWIRVWGCLTTFPAWNFWNFLTVKAITALWTTAAGECLCRFTTEADLGKWVLATQASGIFALM